MRHGRTRRAAPGVLTGAGHPVPPERERRERRLEQQPLLLPLVDSVTLHHSGPAAHLLGKARPDPARRVDPQVPPAAPRFASERLSGSGAPGSRTPRRRGPRHAGRPPGTGGPSRRGAPRRRRRNPGRPPDRARTESGAPRHRRGPGPRRRPRAADRRRAWHASRRAGSRTGRSCTRRPLGVSREAAGAIRRAPAPPREGSARFAPFGSGSTGVTCSICSASAYSGSSSVIQSIP